MDAADLPRLAAHRWHLNGAGYAQTSIGGRTVGLHRFVLETDAEHVDHADGDRLNNTRANLRPCAAWQNQHGRGKHRRNTSGYKGVHRVGARWQAKIMVQGRRRALGCFATAEAAARAYDAAARELVGEFARLNFPTDGAAPNGGNDRGSLRAVEPAPNLGGERRDGQPNPARTGCVPAREAHGVPHGETIPSPGTVLAPVLCKNCGHRGAPVEIEVHDAERGSLFAEFVRVATWRTCAKCAEDIA